LRLWERDERRRDLPPGTGEAAVGLTVEWISR
jgi:hypothetical protein